MTWMKEKKENIEDAQSSDPSLHKKFKQMSYGCDNQSDGMWSPTNLSLMEFEVCIGHLY